MEEVYIHVPDCANVIRGYILQKSKSILTVLLPCGIIHIHEENTRPFSHTPVFNCRFCKDASHHFTSPPIES